ncbi:MAG: response regulator transcription factor [Actinocatenispora sp.]
MTPVRVLIVDDQELVRTGFSLILESRDDIDVVGQAGDGLAAVRLATELRPDVVLMDVRMPGVDGIEATRRIIQARADIRVVMLTTFEEDELVHEALRAGASGFLLKDIRPAELADAVRVVHGGDALLAPSVTRRMLEEFVARRPMAAPQPAVLSTLTAREREVLALVARGASNREIAGDLVLSEATVKTHVSAILRKLPARDRVQAVVIAYDCGLVRPASSD